MFQLRLPQPEEALGLVRLSLLEAACHVLDNMICRLDIT